MVMHSGFVVDEGLRTLIIAHFFCRPMETSRNTAVPAVELLVIEQELFKWKESEREGEIIKT